MQNRRILIGVFASDTIGRETVFVDDMKVEAHARGIRPDRGRLPSDKRVRRPLQKEYV